MNESGNPAPELVWDIDKLRLNFAGIEVSVVHSKLPPLNVSAIVEEQDTDRVLGECTEIRDPGDMPVWYLANKLSSAPQKRTGCVVVCGQHPCTLQAIVHDLDEDPSWSYDWIAEALHNIFSLTIEKNISSIQLPMLGNVHGRFGLENFIALFVEKLDEFVNTNGKTLQRMPLRRIWLMVPDDQCEKAFSILKNKAASGGFSFQAHHLTN